MVKDESGATLLERGFHLGETTNNVAEYAALVRGLELVKALAGGTKAPAAAPKVLVRSDSELMVRQIAGEYRVRNAALKPLFAKAKALLDAMPGSKVEHVPRELNGEADALANRVLDLGRDVE